MTYEEFKLPGFERPVFVHHEEDWSGMAIIEWWDKKPVRVEVPGRLLLALSFDATRTWVINEIEHALKTKFERVPSPDERTRT